MILSEIRSERDTTSRILKCACAQTQSRQIDRAALLQPDGWGFGDPRAECLKYMALGTQVVWLFILSIPIANVTWMFTHEEISREIREYCEKRSKNSKKLLERKMFYLFTCEYCLSHWITLVFVLLTGYRLLLEDWRGVVIAIFALVWVANLYMSFYGRLRLGIKSENKEIAMKEELLERR
jgi:hypothetical protein